MKTSPPEGATDARALAFPDAGRRRARRHPRQRRYAPWPGYSRPSRPLSQRARGPILLTGTLALRIANGGFRTPSPGRTPGRVAPRYVDQRFARPFFVVGLDPVSQEGLQKHRAELGRIGAAGTLIQGRTVGDLRLMGELAR